MHPNSKPPSAAAALTGSPAKPWAASSASLKAGAEQIATAFAATGGPSAAADALEALARTPQQAPI
jgi:hypothetical protein